MQSESNKTIFLFMYGLVLIFLLFFIDRYAMQFFSNTLTSITLAFIIQGLIAIGISFTFSLILKERKRTNIYGFLIIFIALTFVWLYNQLTSSLEILTRDLIIVFINGLTFSMVLFLMVSGFYLIFGLADVINFAHGAFFMLGGFIGFESYLFCENFFFDIGLFNSDQFLFSFICFILAMILTAVIMGIIGGVIEITTIRKLYKKPLNQILLTVGISFVITQIAQIIWGQSNLYIPSSIPSRYFFVTGNITLGNNISFETYSFIIIFIGLLLVLIMFFIFSRTRIGVLVQAAIEDSEMVEALGTNVKLMLSTVFIVGTILAGIAGFILVPSIHGGASTSIATTYLLYAFVIVVVGGAHYGKLEGTFFGSLIIGFSYKFTEIFFYDYTTFIVFLIMAFVLVFKPSGLTGQELTS